MKLLDYSDMIKILLIFLVFGAFYPISAQSWTAIKQLGGIGNENTKGLHLSAGGHLYLAGSFEQSMNFNSSTVSSQGEADAFLAKFSPDGAPQWIRYGGGILDDQFTAMASDAQGNLICIGTYWLEANFEDVILTTTSSPKAIFVLKYNPDGDLLWGISVDGTTLKEATALTIDTQNNIFITGFFADQLLFPDTTLHASGDSDLFILKLSPSGEKEWIHSAGHKGDTRGMSLALTSDEEVILGGFYNDTTRLGNYQLVANTYDRDVFLARFTQSGEVLWAKRAGGVHDDEIVKLVLDDSGQIYITGYLVGVMNLNEQLSIQSGNGNSDFYLMKYSPEGEVLQARAMGGNQVQQTTDIQLLGDQILLSGFYFGNMTIDGISLNSTGIVNGFVASFDTTDLHANWIKSIEGDQTVVTNRIFMDEQNKAWLSGTFSGMLNLGNSLHSNGGFDLFFGPLPEATTSINETVSEVSSIKVYPNPAKTILYIETNLKSYQVALTNHAGQLIHSGQNLTSINIQNLPKGIYLVLVNNPDVHFYEKVVLD